MNYVTERNELYVLLTINEKKLDTMNAPDLKTELFNHFNLGAKNMVIDLGSVSYTDSSGLSALLVGNRLFQEKGLFVLLSIHKNVRKLLEICHLDDKLIISESQEDAIQMIKKLNSDN